MGICTWGKSERRETLRLRRVNNIAAGHGWAAEGFFLRKEPKVKAEPSLRSCHSQYASLISTCLDPMHNVVCKRCRKTHFVQGKVVFSFFTFKYCRHTWRPSTSLKTKNKFRATFQLLRLYPEQVASFSLSSRTFHFCFVSLVAFLFDTGGNRLHLLFLLALEPTDDGDGLEEQQMALYWWQASDQILLRCECTCTHTLTLGCTQPRKHTMLCKTFSEFVVSRANILISCPSAPLFSFAPARLFIFAL